MEKKAPAKLTLHITFEKNFLESFGIDSKKIHPLFKQLLIANTDEIIKLKDTAFNTPSNSKKSGVVKTIKEVLLESNRIKKAKNLHQHRTIYLYFYSPIEQKLYHALKPIKSSIIRGAIIQLVMKPLLKEINADSSKDGSKPKTSSTPSTVEIEEKPKTTIDIDEDIGNINIM